MRSHIFLATPCYGGVVTQGYMQSVIGLMQQAAIDGYDVTLALLGQDALITRCRNTLLGHFMSTEAATHILYVDSDISFGPELAGQLLASRKDVVAASYPLKTSYWDVDANFRLRSGEAPETAGLQYVGKLCEDTSALREGNLAKAIYVGTGFLLISRNTIDRMIAAYPQTQYSFIHAYPRVQQKSSVFHALFDCIIDPATQTYLSEDFAFCHRWRALGGQIWLNTQASLTHTGPMDFIGNPSERFQ